MTQLCLLVNQCPLSPSLLTASSDGLYISSTPLPRIFFSWLLQNNFALAAARLRANLASLMGWTCYQTMPADLLPFDAPFLLLLVLLPLPLLLKLNPRAQLSTSITIAASQPPIESAIAVKSTDVTLYPATGRQLKFLACFFCRKRKKCKLSAGPCQKDVD